MNNPNDLFKQNHPDDPLNECKSLQEYVMDLIELLSRASTQLSNGYPSVAKELIDDCIDMSKEMGKGDWRIVVDKEEEG